MLLNPTTDANATEEGHAAGCSTAPDRENEEVCAMPMVAVDCALSLDATNPFRNEVFVQLMEALIPALSKAVPRLDGSLGVVSNTPPQLIW